jgi:hypothetical protein
MPNHDTEKDIAIECHIVRCSQAVADGEKKQRIFGRLSQRFSLVDQQVRLLLSRLGFRGGWPIDVQVRG